MKACLRQAVWSGLGLAVLWVATSVGLMHMYPRVWKSFALTTGSVSVDTVILSPVCCGVGVAYGARLRRAGVTRTSRAWPRSATAAIVTTWLVGVGAVLLLAVGVTTAILALVASGDADPRLVMGSVLTAMAATAFLALRAVLGVAAGSYLLAAVAAIAVYLVAGGVPEAYETCSSDGLVLRPSTAPLRISPGTPSRCGLDSIVPSSSSPWCSWA
ncbi:hypothetical protein HMPREF1162_0902 [ [[Propionibacterium] namnetense SK182B-JCVI]|uniref:Uncharacterized protein n=1 Tax=[Propionibacterium] namnetense SK182B-JCVI TaxID=1051006 RepID=F9NSA0_9ACTN|nr:hypothetical protein HMPREF1162_0902 [ [[Propionibacterium] namnetense SK182B-JCVI]